MAGATTVVAVRVSAMTIGTGVLSSFTCLILMILPVRSSLQEHRLLACT